MPRHFLLLTMLLLTASAAQGEEYKTVREARAAAAQHLLKRDFAAAQAPLEAALGLTPATDVRQRVEIYRTLTASYRLLPEIDKMLEAVEYIQQHSQSQSERMLVARDAASFIHQRGKTDVAIARYEQRLQQNAKDPAALVLLTIIHQRLPAGNKDRAKLLEGQLQALNRERAIAKAEALAKAANADPAAAASNWKDVAKAWLEAGDKKLAKAAVEQSLKSPLEARSGILTKFWYEGLGDVLLELGERDEAVRQYEAALPFAMPDTLKKGIEQKIEKAKKAA